MVGRVEENSYSEVCPRLAPFCACRFPIALALGFRWPWWEDKRPSSERGIVRVRYEECPLYGGGDE